MRVAILGTGKMGGAMAKRLAGQGYEVVLWNRTRSRAQALNVGEVKGMPAEAAREADMVISMLTDENAVRATYLGRGGAVEVAHHQVFADMSTAGADVSREIAKALERAGAEYVEAPVLGSVGAILGGSAVVLAGGGEVAVKRATPVLEAFGEVRRIGEVGSAAALKLIANTMLAGVYALTAELLAAGIGDGLRAEDVFFVLNRTAPLLTQRKAGFVEHRYEPVTFATRDMVKDLGLAGALFRRLGASTPMSDQTRKLFEKVGATRGADEVSAIASLYEKASAGRTS